MSHEPSYRIFLVMMPFRDVAPDLGVLLGPLRDLESHLLGVEGLYTSTTDTALVGLRLSQRLVDRVGAGWLIALVGEVGLPILTPDEYEPVMREAFYGQHLPGYEHRVDVRRGSAPANTGLVDHVVDALWRRLTHAGAVLPEPLNVPAFAPRRDTAAPAPPVLAPPRHQDFGSADTTPAFEFSDFLESSSIFDFAERLSPRAHTRPQTPRPSSEWELIL